MVYDIIVMTLSRRSLSNREEKPTAMSELSINNVERFLDRKFRASRSYATKETYRGAINRFAEFASGLQYLVAQGIIKV